MPLMLVGVEVDRFNLNDLALTLAKRLNIPIVSDFWVATSCLKMMRITSALT